VGRLVVATLIRLMFMHCRFSLACVSKPVAVWTFGGMVSGRSFGRVLAQ
jgi:hypothetical protein